jgi:hypothetical protein
MKIFDFIVLPVLIIFIFAVSYTPLDYSKYLEASWNNNNCTAMPWGFCRGFYNLYKYKDFNYILEKKKYLEKKSTNNKSLFPCVQPKHSYCRRSGNKVLVSIIPNDIKGLNLVDFPIASKCFVSDLVKKDETDIPSINKLNCEVLSYRSTSRYKHCAWAEDKILLVFDSSRKTISSLINKELNLKSDNFDINITDCFSINPLSSQFQFRAVN